MNLTAQAIRTAVSARNAAELYGLEVNRQGFAHCPFHAGDRNGSLKFYPDGAFHCFGCGAHGSAIDFAMRYLNLSFPDACSRLNQDFHLGLRRQTYRERKAGQAAIQAAQRRARLREELRQSADEAYWAAFDRWRAADNFAWCCRPDKTNGRITNGYAWAVRELPRLAHELDLATERRTALEQQLTRRSPVGETRLSDHRAL